MLRWSEDFIEQPHPVFGNRPVYPFARAARLRKAIRFLVLPFELDDPLDPAGLIMSLLGDLLRDPDRETLFVVHPERGRFGPQALEHFVAKTASDSLLGSTYYDHFTPAMLRAVGMPREPGKSDPVVPATGPRGS